ncbi:MAG: cyclic nucleotide-binding domain-containing protein, partial [Myxococcota bacterium]
DNSSTTALKTVRETDTIASRITLLKQVDLFQELTTDELRSVAESLTRREVASGEVLIMIGEPGDAMYVVLEGLLTVHGTHNGQQTELACLEPGSVAGEMSVLTGESRSAMVLALTDAIVYALPKTMMLTLLESRPELIKTIGRLMIERRILSEEGLNSLAPTQEALTDPEGLQGALVNKIFDLLRNVAGGGGS